MTPSSPGLKSLSDIGSPICSSTLAMVRLGTFCTVTAVRHHGPMLIADEDFDGETFTGDLDGGSGENARFLECVFEDADLSRLRASRARFSECELTGVRGAGVDLSESAWRTAPSVGPGSGRSQLYGAELRRVRFEGCKIEFLNLRGAKLWDVQFVDCQLVEPDLRGGPADPGLVRRWSGHRSGLLQGPAQGRRPQQLGGERAPWRGGAWPGRRSPGCSSSTSREAFAVELDLTVAGLTGQPFGRRLSRTDNVCLPSVADLEELDRLEQLDQRAVPVVARVERRLVGDVLCRRC